MTTRLLLLPLLLALSCEGPRCDPGQTLARNVCIASLSGPDAGDAGDAGVPSDGPAATFGASCGTAADCPAGLDYCMIYQGTPYCTRTGCLATPTACPDGWSCVDLSLYSAGLPAICVRP